MVLVNTIYFKDEWERKLEKAGPDFFETASGQPKYVPFLFGHHTGTGRYLETEGYQAVRLPYRHGAYLALYLPKENLETLLSESVLNEMMALEWDEKEEIDLSYRLPQFDISSTFPDLKDTLRKGSLARLFDIDHPALSVLKDGSLSVISDVIQQTRISVDEMGTTAAAYTEVAIKEATAMPPKELKQIQVIFDRPFVYVLFSSDGIPLFVGCVRDI